MGWRILVFYPEPRFISEVEFKVHSINMLCMHETEGATTTIDLLNSQFFK